VLQSRPVLLDGLLAAAFVAVDTVVTLVGGSWWPARPGALAWCLLAAQAAVDLSLLARRRRPLTVVGVFAAFTVLVTVLVSPAHVLTPAHDGNVWSPMGAVLAAYAPVQRGADRRRGLLMIVALTVAMARPWQPSLAVISIGLLRTAIGPLLAMYFVARSCLVRALTERAERAERERFLLAEQARAQERTRLAAEMHDVVTHQVSLMVLQAGALRMTAKDEEVRQAAEELRAAGCLALDELRDLVGVLRTAREVDPAQPPPSTADFAALAARCTAAGSPTELVEDGDPALASPLVGRTAYHVVREALTNAGKHAPGARVSVSVHYDPREVRISVRNTRPARPVDRSLVLTGSGLGLAGLRQRIDVVRGTLHAGPEPDGGFSVQVRLPAYVPTADAVSEDPVGADPVGADAVSPDAVSAAPPPLSVPRQVAPHADPSRA
jgi:signal transduction histidine kinase